MKRGWIITIAVSVSIVVVLYFYQFHNGLSNNAGDWANFGDYLNGVLTPILTIINIWVFVKLTQVISKSEQNQKEAELSYQKKLLLMQLRQNEFDKFSTILNNALVIKSEDIKNNYLYPVIFATLYINSFLVAKSDLFPIIRGDELKNKLIELHQLFAEYQKTFFSGNLSGAEDITPITRKLIESVNFITNTLQNFILNDIK